MSGIYFPLRSNGAWFTSEQTVSVLERRVKQSFLIYDDLLFEGGRFDYNASATSASGWYVPTRLLNDEERTIHFDPPGTEFQILISERHSNNFHAIGGGVSEIGFSIDWLPLLRPAGLLDHENVHMVEADLSRDEEKSLSSCMRRDSRNPTLFVELPENRYFRDELIKSLYRDSAIATRVGVGFSVDEHAARFIANKCEQERAFRPEPAVAVFTGLVAMGLPDFTRCDWDEIHQLRDSAAGRDFRRVVSEVRNRVLADPTAAEPQSMMQRAILEVSRELLLVIRSIKPRFGQTVFKQLLNVLPSGLGVVSALLDAYEYARSEYSWVSLFDWSSTSKD